MNERWTEFIEEVTKVCKGTDILTSPEDCLIYSHGCYPREYKWLLQGKYRIFADVKRASSGK